MANIYVGMMRDYLKNYLNKQKEFNEQINHNNERYSTDYANEENVKIREQQKQEYNSTMRKINDVFFTVRGLLANASFVNVESLTADRLLFSGDSGFDLSPEEVKAYVERYKDNYTMLRLIKDWIAKHNVKEEGKPFGKYDSVNITLPSDMVSVYKQFTEGALSICNKIYQNQITSNNSMELNCYADENFGAGLFSVIGSGMNLSDYKSKRIPETAQHIFDDITPAEPNTGIYTGASL